tara:strand:- start:223 stop:1539 length:1317 start_codon:yes stop_codon:yes gene_type:complete
MQIFLGLSDISGIFSRLKKGLEKLNHQVDFVNIVNDPFKYSGYDKIPSTLQSIIDAEKKRLLLENLEISSRFKIIYFIKKNYRAILSSIRKSINILLFIKYFIRYDAVIFIYGNSFYHKTRLVNFNDLFWLKLFNIKIIFIYCGSDSRPVFLDGGLLAQMPSTNWAQSVYSLTNDVCENNQTIERFAHKVVSNVFSSYFFTKPIIPFQCMGHPAIEELEANNDSSIINQDEVVVIHAPSSKNIKGTEQITKIVNELHEEGYKFEFKVLSSVENETVLNELKRCDFIIDQLYSDYLLAGFASEAASFAKPAIIGTYLDIDTLKKSYNYLGVPPCEIVHPDNFKQSILKLLEDKNYRMALGKQARCYIQNNMKAETVAKRYIELINNSHDPKWYVNPQDFSQPVPMGLSIDKVRVTLPKLDKKGFIRPSVQKLFLKSTLL